MSGEIKIDGATKFITDTRTLVALGGLVVLGVAWGLKLEMRVDGMMRDHMVLQGRVADMLQRGISPRAEERLESQSRDIERLRLQLEALHKELDEEEARR